MAGRLYSLFEKRGKRYHRISTLALPKQTAVSIFQSALLFGAFGGEFTRSLRPVKDTPIRDSQGWQIGRTCIPPVSEQDSTVPQRREE